MAQTTVDYQASRRWSELWSPIPFTNNLQVWLSLSALWLAIFALFYEPVRRLDVFGVNLPDLYSVVPNTDSGNVVGWAIIGFIGFAALFLAVFCIGSLIYVIVGALKHRKELVDSTNIPDFIKAGMSKEELEKVLQENRQRIVLDKSSLRLLAEQVNNLKQARGMINDFLVEIGEDKNDKPKPIEPKP